MIKRTLIIAVTLFLVVFFGTSSVSNKNLAIDNNDPHIVKPAGQIAIDNNDPHFFKPPVA